MATLYVSSSGSNTAPYDTAAKAATSLATALAAASAGDDIRFDYTDTETLSASTTYSFPGTPSNPCKLTSTNVATDVATVGGIVDVGGNYTFDFLGSVHVWGMRFNAYLDFTFGNGTNDTERQVWEQVTFGVRSGSGNCPFRINGPENSNINDYHFLGCTFDFSLASTAWNGIGLDTNRYGRVSWKNCTVSGVTGTETFFDANATRTSGTKLVIEDSDLSVFTNLVNVADDFAFDVEIRRCLLKSGYAATTGTKPGPYQNVLVEACSVTSGLSVPPLGLTSLDTYYGTISSDLTRYRTGGADDGEQANAYSWAMASSANSLELYTPLESPPMVKWVASGSQTVTIYIAGGAALNDDDFWVEVSSPSEAGSPTAQNKWQTTRANPLATPAAITTDSGSTWNGTGVGTKQKIDVSITPAIAGPVVVRAFLAKPSTTVYLDPKIEVA